jgi:hypothetical protein
VNQPSISGLLPHMSRNSPKVVGGGYGFDKLAPCALVAT